MEATITKEEVLNQVGKALANDQDVSHTHIKKHNHYVFAFRHRLTNAHFESLAELKVQHALMVDIGRSGYGVSVRISFAYPSH